MRRLSVLLVAIWIALVADRGITIAQTTDLPAGLYVDQLTGFSLSWDPDVFDGELSGVGGLRLTAVTTQGDIFASTAATGTDCVSQRSQSERLAVADRAEELVLPTWPKGTNARVFMSADADLEIVLIGCVPVGNPATATTFVLFDIRGTSVGTDWLGSVANWQPVIDSLIPPDPMQLTTTGIADGVYEDPLYGWSVQFDPARYEAQYAGGTADSTFLSGVFLFSEADGESGGIWAERHEDIKSCLEAQSAVNASFPGYSPAVDPDPDPPTADGLESGIFVFKTEDAIPYIAFAGCQPLLVDGETVEGTFLVTSFSVGTTAYPTAAAAWQTMIDSIQFASDSLGTPTA